MEQESLKSYPPLAPMDESSLDVNTSYAQILRFIEGSPKVVDFGCGPGNLARFLAQRGCVVYGVELNPESAGLAREYCADVLTADLEAVSPIKLFPTERFDVAILADILEHLRKPERLLAEVLRILRPGGFVIASIPNIAHGAVRLAMLQGNFNYQEIGILDETHVRFFTRQTVEKLFEVAGLFIEGVARTTAPIFEPSGTLVPAINRTDFTEEVAASVEADPEAQTVQFIVKAVPAASPEARSEANKRKIAALTLQVQDLEAKLRATEAEREEKADAPSRAHFEEIQKQLHLALLGPDGVQSLQAALQQSNDELSKLRDEVIAFEAREQSTKRREKKLVEENGKIAESLAQLKSESDERRKTLSEQQAALEAATSKIARDADALAKLRSHLSKVEAESSRSTEQIAELRRGIAEHESTARAHSEALETARKRIAADSSALQKLRSANQSIADFRSEIARLEQTVQASEHDIAEALSTTDEQQSTIAAMEKEIETALDDVAQARMQTRSLATLHKSSESHRLQLGVEIEDLRSEYARVKRSNVTALQGIEKLRMELEERESARAAMEKRSLNAEQRCAEALGELNEALEALERRESARAAMEQRHAEALGELDKLRAELEEHASARAAMEERLSEAEQRSAEALGDADDLRAELEKRESSYADALDELKRARAYVADLTARLEREELLYKDTDSHRLQLAGQVDELRAAYVEIKRLRNDGLEKVDDLRAELARGEESRSRVLAELTEARVAAAELRRRCETDEFYLAEMRKSKFWRLRNGWFGVKRAFGITTDIP